MHFLHGERVIEHVGISDGVQNSQLQGGEGWASPLGCRLVRMGWFSRTSYAVQAGR